MVNITLVRASESIKITAEKDQSFFEVFTRISHPPSFPCGGRGVCGNCKIKVEGQVSKLTPEEKAHLSFEELASGVRLACFSYPLSDCTVVLLDNTEINIIHTGKHSEYYKDPMFSSLGICIDIGTTTLAAKLFDTQGELTNVVMRNPQVSFGGDVISRIAAALHGKQAAMQRVICNAIDNMILQMLKIAGKKHEDVDALVITGNTAMLYLLTGSNPIKLSAMPFLADRLFGEYLSSEELGLKAIQGVKCYLPRCMHAYVGADITTGLLASGMMEQDDTALLVDIGTNGEMALRHRGKLFCCSTAAGPAFEGAGVERGSHGIVGAIDHIEVLPDGSLDVSVIGDQKAKSICGSGIVDAIAALLKLKQIDETGKLLIPAEIENGLPQRRFFIKNDVYISQKDISMIQMAKSAVCAGILTLLKESGVDFADVNKLYIAGGFGSFLNLKNAASIGLIPHNLLNIASPIGNSALIGAEMILNNKTLIQKSYQYALNSRHVELAGNAYFMDQYIEQMTFDI